MVGSMNWCFGGVATAAAVVRRILDVGGVVRYVFMLVVSLERAIFVDLCLLFGRSLIINRCTWIRLDHHHPCVKAVWRIYRCCFHRIDDMKASSSSLSCWVVVFYSDEAVIPRDFHSLLYLLASSNSNKKSSALNPLEAAWRYHYSSHNNPPEKGMCWFGYFDSLFDSFVNGTLRRVCLLWSLCRGDFVQNELSIRFCGRGNGIACWVQSTIWAAPFIVTFGRLLLSSVTCNTFNSRDEHEVMTTIILRRGQRQSTNLAAFLSAPSFAHHHKRLFDRL